jgi:hypothetical protein
VYLGIHTVYSHHQLKIPDPPFGAEECNSITTSPFQPPHSKASSGHTIDVHPNAFEVFFLSLPPPL